MTADQQGHLAELLSQSLRDTLRSSLKAWCDQQESAGIPFLVACTGLAGGLASLAGSAMAVSTLGQTQPPKLVAAVRARLLEILDESFVQSCAAIQVGDNPLH